MRSLLFVLLISLLATCKDRPDRKQMTQAEIDERLLEINAQMMNNEKAEIRAFISDKDWPMDSTGTGLRYWIYEAVDGPTAQPGQTAGVSFVITLLDGTECYRTQEDEIRSFKVEQSDVESGLHEVIQYLSPGDKAKVILPSHLAYGLTGDMNKIPLKSTLVYDLTLHSLQ